MNPKALSGILMPLAFSLAFHSLADLSSAASSLSRSEARTIIQSAVSNITTVDDADFIEDCCPAWAWKKERLVRLAYVQAKIVDLEGLDQTIKEAKKIGDHRLLHPSQIAQLGYSQASAQDKNRALSTLHDAIEVALLSEYDNVRDLALPTVVRGYALIGETEQAINTARFIRDVYWRVIPLSQAVSERSSFQDASSRSRFIEAALKATSELQDHRDKANGLIAIARAQMENQDTAAAKDSLQKALSSAQLIHNAGYQADTLIQLSTANAEANDLGEGKRIWRKALEQTRQLVPEEQPYRLHYLCSASENIRDGKLLSVELEGLYAKRSLIEDPFDQASFVRELADLHFKIGEPALAMQSLGEATRLALTISRNSLQRHVLMNVAQSYANHGYSAKSIAIANALEEGTLEHRYAYYYLALAQARASDIGGALGSFHAIAKDSYLKAEAAKSITAALSKAGEIESALAWADSLFSPYERALALLGIVQGQFDN